MPKALNLLNLLEDIIQAQSKDIETSALPRPKCRMQKSTECCRDIFGRLEDVTLSGFYRCVAKYSSTRTRSKNQMLLRNHNEPEDKIICNSYLPAGRPLYRQQRDGNGVLVGPHRSSLIYRPQNCFHYCAFFRCENICAEQSAHSVGWLGPLAV